MKRMKDILLAACFFLSILSAKAQTYAFSSPQGYASGVTGGGNGAITIVDTRAELEAALKASGSARIIVSGAVQVDYLSVEVHDKTLLGLPGAKLFTNVQTAGASGIMNLKSSSNVIIRNLTFVGPGAYDSDGRDNLTMDGCTKMWVDHCDFQDGMDGNYDNKGLTDNITVSWCRFRYLKTPKAGGSGGTNDHRFTNLVGSNSDDEPNDGAYSITWQYCWWDEGCVERMTRARNAQLHFLNCYWNTSVGKVLLGLENADAYVENSVFAGSGTKYKNYGGTVRLTSVGSTAPPENVGTCPSPSYNHEAISASLVVSAIKGNCGAGATLTVTTGGVISASCNAPGESPTLTTNSAENQSLVIGTAITPIVYTWGGSATGVSVTGLPTGLSGVANTGAKTYTISGTPSSSGTYNISTTQTAGDASISSGKITLTLAIPGNVTATSTDNSAKVNWSTVTGATGYIVNLCAPSTSPAPKRIWDFTDGWSITSSSADANLVLDTDVNRFNYVPATTNAAFKFANGSAIPDVDGLLFTQTGLTKVRLGFNSSLLYLNGAGITISIPCAVGDKVAVVGPAGNTTSVDRGYSVAGGTLSANESSDFINSSGIITQAGAIGTWVYTATTTSVKITTVTGGMNIQKIVIGGNGSSSTCKEYLVSGGSTTTYTANNLTTGTLYTYQVKATNNVASEASAYSTGKTIAVGNPLGMNDTEINIASNAVIYPNPSLNFFQVSGINGTATISVSELSGKLLFTKEVMANEAISTETLVSGIYMVKIVTANGTAEKKLVQK